MTDLARVLPSFPAAAFAGPLAAVERHGLSTTDLLALHPADVAKQTQLSLLDLRRLVAAVRASLADDVPAERLLVSPRRDDDDDDAAAAAAPAFISTLDDDLDAALGGGVPVGCVTEFAGESGAGKTQLLLSLCLAVQLGPPRGPRRQAVYISTESGPATQRLKQMMAANPVLAAAADDGGPSLDNILVTLTPDLEFQEHILEYQVPVLVSRHRVGLVVIDSVAANYRAEFDRRASHASNMAARGADLVRLGSLLRDLARRHAIAVVVANQVADRFSHPPSGIRETPPASLAATPSSSSPFPYSPFADDAAPAPPALRLDHQQRWFTGWGDDPHASDPPKTPSLGLVWSMQIACRVALLKRPVYGPPRSVAAIAVDHVDDDDCSGDAGAPALSSWRRWMKVVFAPHVGASGPGVHGATEFEVTPGGLKAVKAKTAKS